MAEVSVIMPARNAAAYLGEAIASVQAQTVRSWELLVVDDGSTDATPTIAEEFARSDPRIRVLRAAVGGARGAAAARNRGLAAARAAFVAFLDADDLFEPHKLSVDLAAFEAHPEAAMVYGPTLWWWQDGAERPRLEGLGRYVDRLHAPPRLFADVLIHRYSQVPCTCAVLMRSDVLKAVGGFEEAFELYEDQTLWAKVMLRRPVWVHSTPTSRYRQHAGSSSAQAERDGRYDATAPHKAQLAFLEWSLAEARNAGVFTPGVRRALRIALSAHGAEFEPLTPADRLLLLKRRALDTARSAAVRLLRRRRG